MSIELEGRPVKLESGNTLYVKEARFEDSDEMLAAFLEANGGTLSPDGQDDDVVRALAEVCASKFFRNPRLKAAMWKCLGYCLHKKGELVEKVTPQLFDGVAARTDAARIFYECAYENLSPFLVGLWNVSTSLASLIKNTQPLSESPEKAAHS